MAGTGAGKWSTTAANNTSVQTTNWAEGMAPSDVNNAARESLSHIRSAFNGVAEGYVEYGDGDGEYTVTKIDADSFTITSSSDLRSIYAVGKPIRITHNSGVTSGLIASNAYSSPTLTINCENGVNITGSTITKIELGISSSGSRVTLDADGDTFLSATTDDQIDVTVGGTAQLQITDGVVSPTTDSDVDIGTTAKRFKDAYVDSLTVTGNITAAGDIAGASLSTTLATSVLSTVYPVGSIYINATNATNPATLLGFGTWVAFGAGRVPVGIDGTDTDFDTAEETGGGKTHTLAEANLPAHKHKMFANHSMNGTTTSDWARINNSATGNGYDKSASLEYWQSSGSDDYKYRIAFDTANATPTVHPTESIGSGTATDHMNPYIVVHMWKRTA
jgi:microcystin-dependent protein